MAQDDAVWGLHIDHAKGDTPIVKGYSAVGWHELGDVSKLEPTRQAFKQAYATAIPTAKPGAIPVSAGQVFRFIHEMKIGDYVVYPSRHDRMINIGRIIGDYEYVLDDDAEYPHRRKTEWLKCLNRDKFSQTALWEVGAAMTLFSVTTHAEEFLAALSGELGTQAADLDDQTTALIAEHFEETTEDFVLKRLKSGQSSYEFEHFIAHLLRCMGYFARVTKASGDGGIDVIAHRDQLGFEPPIIKVQCKQTFAAHDRPEVQKLYGAIEKEEKGLFVTLGSYTAGARTFEQNKANLRLIDGKELVELIFDHYEKFSPAYRSLLPLKRTFSPGI